MTQSEFPAPTARSEKAKLEERARRVAQAIVRFDSFCGLLQIRTKDGGQRRQQMLLTGLQRKYNAARTSRDIVLKPRQIYFTTLESARDLWWFLTKPGARVVVVCQSQTDMAALNDLGEKFRIFFDSLQRVGLKLDLGRDAGSAWTLPARDSTLRIIQAGASEASASKKGRGGTVNRLHVSEAAFFERPEDTFNSLMESVPKEGSEVVNESTPNGASGFYYDQWCAACEGRSVYTPHFFEWWTHPEYNMALAPGETFEPATKLEQALFARGVSAECLKWYRWKIAEKGGNADLVAQEYPSDPDSCFLLSGRCFFDTKLIAEGLIEAVEAPIAQHIRSDGARGQVVAGVEIPALRVWHEPVRGQSYVVPIDASEGTGGDAGAAMVLERGTGRHMATLWGQFRPWELAKYSVSLAKRYNNALIAPERNNHGGTVIRAIEAEQHYANVFRDRDDKFGFLTSEVSRTPILDTLEQAHRSGAFRTNDRHLLVEMRTFTVNDRGRAEAAPGKKDDLVMTAAIGWDVICRAQPGSGRIASLPTM